MRPAVFSHPAHSLARDLPFLFLQLLDPDKSKAPSVVPPPKVQGLGPQGKMGVALH